MNVSDLLTAAKDYARISANDDEVGDLLLMLSAAAGDVAHAAEYTLPDNADDLPDDIKLAILDQAAMLYDARGNATDRPVGLSMAASRIVSRYRGVAI